MEKGKNTGFSVAGGNGATEDRRSARLLKRSVRQRFRAGKDRADTTWSFRFPLKRHVEIVVWARHGKKFFRSEPAEKQELPGLLNFNKKENKSGFFRFSVDFVHK